MLNFVIIVGFFVGSGYAAEWSYEFETKWPGACQTGLQQSPINIISQQAVVDRHGAHLRGPLVFRGYQNVNMSAVNNGHTLKWTIEKDVTPPVVSGGPLRGNYSFLQFHLHWLSEHAIDGIKYPMEIHMVHIKTGLTVPEAVKRPDGLAVIGVLCEVHSGDVTEFGLKELAPSLPSLLLRNYGYANASLLDVTRLFSPEPQSYFTYHGSLTTPQCQEVVTWIVMDKPLTISDSQYKLFRKVDVGGIDNYRSLQAVNRVVYRSSASIVISNPLAVMAGLLSISSTLTSTLNKGICTVVNMKKKFFSEKLKQCENETD